MDVDDPTTDPIPEAELEEDPAADPATNVEDEAKSGVEEDLTVVPINEPMLPPVFDNKLMYRYDDPYFSDVELQPTLKV